MAQSGIVRRLLKDRGANVIAIGAASIIPLVGVVGGGVDASRMYLAKSRLQQACDAATLAARKKLAGGQIAGSTIPADIENTADDFFDTNFPAGQYGTTNVSYELTNGTATRMDGAASASVPTTLMRVFNKPQVDIAVTCSAELNLPNIDVVLVLDQSGSMDSPADSSNPGGDTRMEALKKAVFSFYDEVMAAKPAGSRVRIGIVPYNSNVNVGSMLTTLSASTGIDYVANSWKYQTRLPKYKQVSNDDGIDEGDPVVYFDDLDYIPKSTSNWKSTQVNHYRYNDNNTDRNLCNAKDGTYAVGNETWEVLSDHFVEDWWSSGNPKGMCYGRIRKTRPATAADTKPHTYRTEFDYYEYRQVDTATNANFDVAAFKATLGAGTTVSTPTGYQGASRSSSWTGCIEERKTVAQNPFTSATSAFYDLDIDLIPDNSDRDTQWYAMWPEITYARGGSGTSATTGTYYRGRPAALNSANEYYQRTATCPEPAYKLQPYPLSGTNRNATFTSRINALTDDGGTLHDVGMIWAGRMISPDGIFKADNASAPNGEAISRHVIFMTDGKMGGNPSFLTAYGNYDMDGRFAGFAGDGAWDEDDLARIHSDRLAAVCDIIKNKNVTIWSVAFGLAHTNYTRNCATGGSARAFTAASSSELDARFRQIAQNIAELRLVQ